MKIEAVVEFLGEAAEDVVIPDISPAEAGAGHPAEVTILRDEDDRLAHAGRLDGGGDPTGGVAIDHDFGFGQDLSAEEDRLNDEGEEGEEAGHDSDKGLPDFFASDRKDSKRARERKDFFDPCPVKTTCPPEP